MCPRVYAASLNLMTSLLSIDGPYVLCMEKDAQNKGTFDRHLPRPTKEKKRSLFSTLFVVDFTSQNICPTISFVRQTSVSVFTISFVRKRFFSKMNGIVLFNSACIYVRVFSFIFYYTIFLLPLSQFFEIVGHPSPPLNSYFRILNIYTSPLYITLDRTQPSTSLRFSIRFPFTIISVSLSPLSFKHPRAILIYSLAFCLLSKPLLYHNTY